jgi:Holliday junction resolvasome RuvABC ATP-dependent DNA helicase subunit
MTDSQHELVAPTTFDQFVGQVETRRRLDVHIRASMEKQRPLPHVLLVGTPGSGKTTLARLMAERLGDNFITISRPPTEAQLREALYELEAGVLFVDEAQDLSPKQQSMFLPLLEEGKLEGRWGTDEFPFLTVCMATTDPQKLIDPLASPTAGRFPIRPYFEPYSDDELARIVAGMAQRAKIDVTADEAIILGTACAGVPRRARSFVFAARDLADAEGRRPTADEVLAFCQVDRDGLTRDHRDYLEALAHLNARAGAELLASRLRMAPKTLRDTEVLLIDRNYIRREAHGRVLTADGRRRITGDKPVGRFRRPAA